MQKINNYNNENIELIKAFIIYMKEKYGIDYLNDPRYIGMMYYGSRLTGNYNKTSDLDLCIICDSESEKEYKGVVTINGIDVEYIEKTEDSIYSTTYNDYKRRNSFPKSAYSRAYTVFEKNNCITNIKEYVNQLYSKDFELPLAGEVLDDLVVIENRISDLKSLDVSNDDSFDILYYTLLDRIKTAYHKMNNISRIEIYKAVRAYNDPKYKETALGIDTPIDEKYIILFMQCFNSNDLAKEEKLKRLDNLIRYIESSYSLSKDNFEFEIYKRPPFYQSKPVILNTMKNSKKVNLSEKNSSIVNKFIAYKDLLNRQDYIGSFIYKNNLQNANEIEMIVLLDSSSEEMFKGSYTIDGVTIKYVMVHDKYLSNSSFDDDRPCPYKPDQQGFLIPNNITYSIIADDRNTELVEDFALRLFKQNFKKIESSKYSSEMIVIDNRMKRLESFIDVNDCDYFDMYYYIIMSKMINAYRNKIGNCYIDPNNIDNKKFIDYYNAALNCRGNKSERFNLLNGLYKFLKGNIDVSLEERVDITPKSKENNKGTAFTKKRNHNISK